MTDNSIIQAATDSLLSAEISQDAAYSEPPSSLFSSVSGFGRDSDCLEESKSKNYERLVKGNLN
jgi:hypothetical protein